MADDGEVVGSEAGTDGGLVFVELDVQAPVKAVLYLPVTANGARDARGVGRQGADVVAALAGTLARGDALALDDRETLQICPLIGLVEPVDGIEGPAAPDFAAPVAIVAGFQGINAKGDATTLGRGGSDTSAVALAVALGADICEIYTDVDGVFTADPRIVPKASRIPVIGYDEILEMSSCGSKVLALRCVEYAQRFNMPLHVRSSFSHRPGTLIVPDGVDPRSLPNID